MALGHGLQDAQKTMGVIFLALLVGRLRRAERPAAVLGDLLRRRVPSRSGTYAGGWRIMRTLGRRIIHLDPARGFAAESVAAAVLYTTAFAFHAPISTTHTITSAVMGVGATKRLLRRPVGCRPVDRGRLGLHLPGAPRSWPPSTTPLTVVFQLP